MPYNPALDGIRALAILLVLGFHSGAPGFRAGFFGVDVFFVLSGYLITQILAAEHERTGVIDLPRFYVRRLRRLWPPMLSMLAVYLILAPVAFSSVPMTTHLRDAFVSAIYMADYARTLDMPPAVMRHMWSLSIEEHFYLVWPLLLLALLRLPRKWAIAGTAGLFVAVTLWRYVNLPTVGWEVYHRFDTHASGLFLGCLLGLVRARLPSSFAWLGTALMVVAFTQYVHKAGPTMRTGFTMAELASGLIVISQPKWLGWAPLAWLGRMSYGLYLWHFLFQRTVGGSYGWEVLFAANLIGGTACAALSYYTIEAHFRRKSLPVERNLNVVEVAVEIGPASPGHVEERVDVRA